MWLFGTKVSPGSVCFRLTWPSLLPSCSTSAVDPGALPCAQQCETRRTSLPETFAENASRPSHARASNDRKQCGSQPQSRDEAVLSCGTGRHACTIRLWCVKQGTLKETRSGQRIHPRSKKLSTKARTSLIGLVGSQGSMRRNYWAFEEDHRLFLDLRSLIVCRLPVAQVRP